VGWAVTLVVTFSLGGAALLASRTRKNALISGLEASQNVEAKKAQVMTTYSQLPLSFEPNQGQTRREVRFQARGRGYKLLLMSNEVVLALEESEVESRKPGGLGLNNEEAPNSRPLSSPGTGKAVLEMGVVGASPTAEVSGLEELPGRSNYFIGNDPQNWRTSIPNYSKVQYKSVYPGVDLIYYGNQGQLEYDFVLAPGADPSRISLAFAGERQAETRRIKWDLRIDAKGDLVVDGDGSEVRFHKPVVYQPGAKLGQSTADRGPGMTNSAPRTLVDGRYVLRADNQVGFELAAYDRSRPLVIDPVLNYSTYLGGGGADAGYGIAVDSSGNAYVTGRTTSTNFSTQNPYQRANAGGADDVFVTKFNPAGSGLVYSTYLGGAGDDIAYAIALDSSDNVYLTGSTTSLNFPTRNPFQAKYGGGPSDAFVTKLNPQGTALVYSTYLGGRGLDTASGIAVDPSGSAYVTGQTNSNAFPIKNAFQAGCAGGDDAFVTKFSPTGSALVYSTYLGGIGSEAAYTITIDSSRNAYVAGGTTSTNFPTKNAFQPIYGGNGDGFVTKFDPTGKALVYSTYLGGNGFDSIGGIAVDSSGDTYVSGGTNSPNFPLKHAFQPHNHGQYDAFVTKFNPTGKALVFSTYLGGSKSEFADTMALDSVGNIYLAGYTESSNFPTKDPIQPQLNSGSWDAFVAEFNPTANALIFSSYLGGSRLDWADSIVVDPSHNIYLTGGTASSDFPTMNPFQPHEAGAGTFDAIVVKISP
jgi:hypothetical protein